MITRSVFDNIVILVYLISVLSVGVYYSRYNRNSTDYFLGGRKFGWITIGLSLFIANIVIEQFIGMSGLNKGNGILTGYLEFLAAVLILLSIWVLMPVIFKSNIFTISELFEQRFNPASRIYITSVTLIIFVITNLTISLYVGCFLLNKTMGWDMVTSGVVLIVVTGIYSITGGMKAVMYTGVLQAVILLSGLLMLMFFGLSEAGDLNAILTRSETVFSIFQPLNDPELPWTGVLFALPVLGIWYWYIDQFVAQRMIAGENIGQARKGGFFAAGLKISSIFLIAFPVIIAVSLFPEISPDQAFVALTMSHIIPFGIKGLVISGILAAVMSSLGHCFNGSSTLITMDFYRRLKPAATEHALVLTGRLTSAFFALLAIIIVLLIRNVDFQMLKFLIVLYVYITPPVAAVFLLGVLWKSISGQTALWTMITGLVISLARVLMITMSNEIYSVSWLDWFIKVNPLNYGLFLFAFSLLLMSVLTLTEKIRNYKKDNAPVVGFSEFETGEISTGKKKSLSHLNSRN